MFLGKYERSIDDKKRIIVPPKLRENIGNSFYVTINSDNNLEIRTKEEFQKFLDKIEENNSLDPLVKQFKRLILGNTQEVMLDKIGRFTLDELHAKTSAIKKEVVFVGMGSTIEIWAKENYEQYNDQVNSEDSLAQLTKKMFDKGIKL
ncbi:MAG: division/cell wall cluster transcriptional repressor MraZ [Metamycoplasmataceae bacterium]